MSATLVELFKPEIATQITFKPNMQNIFLSWPCLCTKSENKKLTVPATDFDDKKVFALNLDNPKSHTWAGNEKNHFLAQLF